MFGPAIGPLIKANPKLELEIIATDWLVDNVDEGFDARIRLCEILRDGMTAVKIRTRLRFAVVGSPAYFGKRSVPGSPEELSDHICVRNIYPGGATYPWAFERYGRTIEFMPQASLGGTARSH